jgi:hypothetical protein
MVVSAGVDAHEFVSSRHVLKVRADGGRRQLANALRESVHRVDGASRFKHTLPSQTEGVVVRSGRSDLFKRSDGWHRDRCFVWIE